MQIKIQINIEYSEIKLVNDLAFELEKGSLENASGTVQYPKEFDEVS